MVRLKLEAMLGQGICYGSDFSTLRSDFSKADMDYFVGGLKHLFHG